MSSPEPEPKVPVTHRGRIMAAFDREELRRICLMPERRFAKAFDMKRVKVARPEEKWRSGTAVKAATTVSSRTTCPDDFYAFRDNGASILAVAHLDTCVWPMDRMCDFAETADGTVVHSGALDDRLGAYVILDMLPKLGINVDVLLTTGEETGKSTAKFFDPPEGKEYNWIIEFDRGGTDVVMYQYDNRDMDTIVKATGARTASGAFSDICYLEHLGVKGFNWGVGYQNYHSVRGYAYIEDLFEMLTYFLRFHEEWGDFKLEHDPKDKKSGRNWRTTGYSWGSPKGGRGNGGHGRGGGGWPADSGSGGWWTDKDDEKKQDKKEDRARMNALADSVIDEMEGSGPMVLVGNDDIGPIERVPLKELMAGENELDTVSLDQLAEEMGVDVDRLVEIVAAPPVPPQWGDSLPTDPADPDFVSQA